MAELALSIVGGLAPVALHGLQGLFGGGVMANREPNAEPGLVLYAGIWGWLYNRQMLEQYRIAAELYQEKMRQRTLRMMLVSVLLIVCHVGQVILCLHVLSGWSSQLTKLVALVAPAFIMYFVPGMLFALFDLQSNGW